MALAVCVSDYDWFRSQWSPPVVPLACVHQRNTERSGHRDRDTLVQMRCHPGHLQRKQGIAATVSLGTLGQIMATWWLDAILTYFIL